MNHWVSSTSHRGDRETEVEKGSIKTMDRENLNEVGAETTS